MKNKKGFTLIEIIICISLIVVIGTASFFGIKIIRKNILVDKLEKINDKILSAAEVYIETNKETYNQLYKKKNGVVIPLNVLVNEGLLSLENTDLKQTDIEDEYVITALTSTTPSSTSDCIDIRTSTSWMSSSSAPIYICTNSSSGGNLTITTDDSNYDKVVNKERYVFQGSNPDNYINYNSKTYKIMSIEKDDSLILVSSDSFGTTFSGVTESVEYYERSSSDKYSNTSGGCSESGCLYTAGAKKIANNQEALLSGNDIKITSTISKSVSSLSSTYVSYHFNTYLHSIMGSSPTYASYHTGSGWPLSYVDNKGYKIHIKNCMKITGGTGNEATPFILENKCS